MPTLEELLEGMSLSRSVVEEKAAGGDAEETEGPVGPGSDALDGKQQQQQQQQQQEQQEQQEQPQQQNVGDEEGKVCDRGRFRSNAREEWMGRGIPEGGDANATWIIPELRVCNCHFNWDLEKYEVTARTMLLTLIRGDEEYSWSEKNAFRDLDTGCLKAFYYYLLGRCPEAHACLDSCEKDAQDPTLASGKRGLNYLLSANRAFVLCRQGRQKEARELLQENEVSWDRLRPVDMALVLGVKGLAFSHYGSRGNKKAADIFFESSRLEPWNPEWHFWVGKCLGRVRREDSMVSRLPSPLECRSLEKAVELNPTSTYMLFLAQCLREKATALFHRQTAGKGELHRLNLRSLNLYTQALAMNPDCPRTNVRCAEGFIRLPYAYRKERSAERCFELALRNAPDNSMVHHKYGCFLERCKGNHRRAMEHYELAAGPDLHNFPALMSMTSLKMRMDYSWNPVPLLERAIQAHRESPVRVASLLCFQGMYVWTTEKNYQATFDYWKKAIRVDPSSRNLFVRRSIMFSALRHDPEDHLTVCDILIRELTWRLPREPESPLRREMAEVLEEAKKLQEANKAVGDPDRHPHQDRSKSRQAQHQGQQPNIQSPAAHNWRQKSYPK